MANAGCINAIGFDGCFLRTLQCLDSSNIGVGVQYTAPNPLDDKRFDYITYTDKCGCQCCLTDENEILIYATQGVIKNLTLTNDDTNEKVIVKWTDLFGSNRAKTVVRYKTGSYPSSPTDGTLAVEETTQNQYQTNGYGVSGLTDGTTYYFSVFALDGDGTTINVQSMNITTDFEWKPDTNTVMHFPFKNDILDKVGNATIPISGTKQSIGYQFSSSGSIDFTNPPTNCRFISVWLKYISSQGDYNQTTSTYIGEVLYNFNHKSTDFYHRFQYHSNANSSTSTTTIFPTSAQQNTNSNQWYHMAYGTDGTKVYAYLNSVKVRETTIVNGLKTNTSMKLFQQMNIVFGELIGEKTMRTQTDITNYFNKTKGKYGY